MKNKKIWDLKQSSENNEILEMYLYGDVEGDYYDWWEDRDVISETSANHFKQELDKYPNIQKINIYINSYGGSVFEGTAIYSQLKRHPAEKIVYIDGFACSVASVIAMAGDKIIMPSNTMMMIHNAWTSASGNAEELRKAADNLDVIMTANRQAYLNKAGDKLKEEELIQMLDGETWLTAEQCVELGLADEILDKEVDLTNAQQLLQKANNTLESQLQYNKILVAQYKQAIEDNPIALKKETKQKNKDHDNKEKPENSLKAIFYAKNKEE